MHEKEKRCIKVYILTSINHYLLFNSVLIYLRKLYLNYLYPWFCITALYEFVRGIGYKLVYKKSIVNE